MSRVRVTEPLRRQARGYYALMDECRRVGVPTSLDDPHTPHTVAGTAAAVAAARTRRGQPTVSTALVLAEYGLGGGSGPRL